MYRRCVTEEAARRQAEVEQCLLSLMCEQPYDKVSVSTICQRMDISRTAFYRYYQDKDSCLQSLLERTLYEAAVFVNGRADADGMESLTRMLRFWRGQSALLDALDANDLMDRLVLQVVRYVQQEEQVVLRLLSTAHVGCDEDVLIFTFSGLLGLIVNWHRSGFRLSEEEMARKICRLMLQPLVQL